MKRNIIYGIFIILFLTQTEIKTQAQSEFKATEYELMSLFVSHFPKYITFPSQQANKPIKITVLGDSPLLTSLKKVVSKNSNLILTEIDSLEGLKDTEILVIGEDFKTSMEEVISITQDKKIMIVSHGRGMEKKGSCINFYIQDSRVKFKISKDAIKRNDLKVSAQLLKLATIVD